ncbi:MAG: hypothetical protein DME84_08910 [Verrucomicrobia bacterium]|nr:MAG: hypothetical protein DME84_08910 [Verrucomicrobiota bacterium]PYK49558.1 MAG: hypothetical protein DME51_08065 [Verrucomicrobiota bacterium]
MVARVGRLAYWSAVAVIFAWAAWLRFRLPLDPIADHGTWGYLSPALRKLIGAEFGHTYGRNFIYPGFLFLLLRAFGDFRAITVAQHFLGLIAGGVLLLTWRRARAFVPDPRVGRGGHYALGLLAAAVFLLASGPIRFETQLRPEGVCAFLFSINLYLVIQFVACCFIENRPTAAAAYGIAAVFSSILLASVKPSFALVATVALLPISMFFFRRGWLWQKIALGGGAVASAALLLLPEHFLSRNDEESQTLLPTALFVIHADLIRDQMAEDIQRNAKVPYSREWLGRVHSILSAEIGKSSAAGSVHYSTLGFDPGYLMYNRSSIAPQLHKQFANNVSALCAFYWFYYWRIWQQRPFLVVKKIARQMAIFYRPVCPAYNSRKFWSLTDVYEWSIFSLDSEPYRKIWATYRPAVDFMNRTAVLAQSAPVIEQRAYIRKPLLFLAKTYLVSLFIALVVGAAVLFHKRRRRRVGWLAALVLFVYSYNLANCLEVAVLHSLHDPRYKTVQMFFTILAQFLALWFIVEFALEMRARAKTSVLDKCSMQRTAIS